MASYHKYTKQVKETIKDAFPDATFAVIDETLKSKRSTEDNLYHAVMTAKDAIENAQRVEVVAQMVDTNLETTKTYISDETPPVAADVQENVEQANIVENGEALVKRIKTESEVREFVKDAFDAKTKATSKAKKTTKKTSKHTKKSNFDLVDSGVCPHGHMQLGQEQVNKGTGAITTCMKCEHKWYINRTAHTCVCLTCREQRKKS